MKEDYAVQLESGALQFERTLPGPIERVWEYLVDPAKRELWFCGGTMGEGPGDRYIQHFNHDKISPEPRPDGAGPGGEEIGATIIAIEPPKLLTVRWDGDGQETTFALSEEGEMVKLVLTQTPPADLANLVSMAAGWHAHIGVLIDHLKGETHRGWWTEHQTAEDHYKRVLAAAV